MPTKPLLTRILEADTCCTSGLQTVTPQQNAAIKLKLRCPISAHSFCLIDSTGWLVAVRALHPNDKRSPIITKVEQALKALISPDELGDGEQEEYFKQLSDSYWEPSPVADAFFADRRRRRRGVGVGMDEAGNIVYATPPGPAAS